MGIKLVLFDFCASKRCAASTLAVSVMRVLTADCWSTWGAEVGAKVGMVGVRMHLPLGGARSDRIALCACGKLSRSAARHLTFGQ